ncbi:hypothetical protein HED60_13355 [Planctomycetales bacterium ZRK34]|nr:hypothetical protein HED60_13355 [Planctomycetales bacterium ZRK34]
MFTTKRHLIRVVATGVLVAAVAFASTGFHMAVIDPQAGQIADSGEWYPCKGHHCGCVSAEMCRTACCCGMSESEPAPEPETESCCAEPEAPEPTVTMTIQSAKCHGRDLTLMLAAITWTSDRPTSAMSKPAPTGYAHAPSTLFVDLVDALIDPPPPRAA